MYRGDLVILRAYQNEDLPKIQKFLNDFETRGLTQFATPYPYTLEDEEKWYESNSAVKDTYTFAIETLDGVFLGGCGINAVDWKNSKVELGILIGNKDYWGKGYGSDAVKLLIKFIFEEMNINKIYLNVSSYNKRAIGSYKKCGFVEEGILKEEIFHQGEFHDKIYMGFLKKDYFSKKMSY